MLYLKNTDMKPKQLATTYEDIPQWCDKCQKVRPHTIALYKANDSGVIYFKSCNECYENDEKQNGKKVHPWEIERIPVTDWNCLIKLH